MSLFDSLGIEKEQMDWTSLAKCRGADTNLFFDLAEDSYNIYDNVKHMCNLCFVKKQCLAEGIKGEDYGIWGGSYLVKGIPVNLHEARK